MKLDELCLVEKWYLQTMRLQSCMYKMIKEWITYSVWYALKPNQAQICYKGVIIF